MNTALDAEMRSMMEAALARFVDDAYDPSQRLMRLRAGEVNYRLHWPMLTELGLPTLALAEAQGGVGGNILDLTAALSVLARGLVLEPLAEAAVIARNLLAAADASADLQQLVAGEQLPIVIGGRSQDALRCTPTDDGFLVHGDAEVVPGAAQADVWLLVCRDTADEPVVLRVSPSEQDEPRVHMRSYRLMDGRSASNLHFDAWAVPLRASLLQGDAAAQALRETAAVAVGAYCADACGAMQQLVTITSEYLRTREQFGVTLSTFQALQHRLADMHMAALESQAITRALARAIDAGDARRVQWLCFAAPNVVCRAGSRIGHEAIQMHGGMGVTEELVVSHYNARLVVLAQLLSGWSSAAEPSGDNSHVG